MANIQSAKKRTRQIQKRTFENRTRMNRVRTFIRKVETAILSGNKDEAKTTFVLAESEVMRGAQKGIYHKKRASRKISRLAKKLKALVA